MSETYQSKRERWQRLRASLPDGLRNHVSLRNVEAVAALPATAQARLAEALQVGLKHLPRAIARLRTDPHASLAELLHPPLARVQESSIPAELADLIQVCYPDMPRVSAEALAQSEVLEIARASAHLFHELFTSQHLRTDFVALIVYGLMRQSLEHLEAIIHETPALLQAFHQSPAPWKPNDWRK